MARPSSIAPLCVAALACGTSTGGENSTDVGPRVRTDFSVSAIVLGNGSINSAPSGIACGKTCSGTFNTGSTVHLSAQPDAGWTFAGWSGDCSGMEDCALSKDSRVTAAFRQPPPPPPPPPRGKRTLSVTLAGHGRVQSAPSGIDCSSSCSASYDDGARVQLTAQPDAGWSFTSWSGACSGSPASCVITLSSDQVATATFTAVQPATDECDGLLPAALPTPVLANLPQNSCLDGMSDDGAGNYLLGYTAGSAGPSYPNYLFYTIQNGSAVRIGDAVPGGDQNGTYIYSQPSGFTGLAISGFNGSSAMFSYGHDGTKMRIEVLVPGEMALNGPSSAAGVDPSGGTAIARHVHLSGGATTTYQRYDKTGAPESAQVLIDNVDHRVDAVGVALSGHALVVENVSANAWQGRWVARDGAPITDWFPLPGYQTPQRLFPSLTFLMDGSLVLGFDNHRQGQQPQNIVWQSRFPDGASAPEPLPAWLQSRANSSLAVIRGGRGYASMGSAAGCGPSSVEVLGISGKSCGCVKPAHAQGLNIGRDGSLIVSEPPVNFGTCVFDLYPQLFQ